MEAWKAMVVASAVLALFAIVVSVVNVNLTGPTVAAILAFVTSASLAFYAFSKRGFQFGQGLGESMREKK
ncbi:hypothetical protein [Halorhabdus rudnickae]|uniref:hypothetical protein n=1 Tax=Halorhabdus rudnickae TaxID=1775544 RepID=UPI001082E1A2|nr:hypothetical protein [Halorhabdus rudnickae]